MLSTSSSSILQFAPFHSLVDEQFWRRLSSLKLDKLGIDDSPINITEWGDPQHVSKAVGWEPNNGGKLLSRIISLEESMNPERLVVSAADLNLKIMRLRTLPSPI